MEEKNDFEVRPFGGKPEPGGVMPLWWISLVLAAFCLLLWRVESGLSKLDAKIEKLSSLSGGGGKTLRELEKEMRIIGKSVDKLGKAVKGARRNLSEIKSGVRKVAAMKLEKGVESAEAVDSGSEDEPEPLKPPPPSPRGGGVIIMPPPL